MWMWCGIWFAYAGVAEAVSHDEVEGGAGLAPVLVDGAAAVLEHLLAQVGALLRLLLEQQVSELDADNIRVAWIILARVSAFAAHSHQQEC